MAWVEELNIGGTKSRRNTVDIATVENSITVGHEATRELFYEIEPAEVVDIILNTEHPEFNSWQDIGKIRFRFIYSQNGIDFEKLSWAKPLESNIKNYPLIHEVVLVASYVNESALDDHGTPNDKMFYYFHRLNIFNSTNNSVMRDISFFTNAGIGKGEYKDISPGSKKSIGNEFIDKNRNIKPLLPKEGDIIIEGRFGNSIRLGSGNLPSGRLSMNPRIYLRNSQNIDVSNEEWPVSFIEEDINKDGSTILMSSDPLLFIRGSEYYRAMNSVGIQPNKFEGEQVIINSDRIIFNSKKFEFLVYSNRGIGLSTDGSVSIDAGRELYIDVGNNVNIKSNKHVITSNKIYIGSERAKEPIVLGNVLLSILEDLISSIESLQYHYSMIPGSNRKLLNVKQRLKTLLSKQNFTV